MELVEGWRRVGGFKTINAPFECPETDLIQYHNGVGLINARRLNKKPLETECHVVSNLRKMVLNTIRKGLQILRTYTLFWRVT